MIAKFLRFQAYACLLAMCAAPIVAQTNAGATLTGAVSDPRGALLPNASVVLHNQDFSFTRKATSDAAGHYTISGVRPGHYEVDTEAPGFAVTKSFDVALTDGQSTDLNVTLNIGNLNSQVTVEAEASDSVAAQLAPIDSRLDARSARSEITDHFIENFNSPVADYSESTQMAPGTFSVNPNGIGLGDSKSYFRGFSDGNYDITFDGIPFEDTNSPTHHSWAFFPSQWLGGVDFDRSPGSASTVGPTPFGGSINLLSKPATEQFALRGGVSYGSFNTQLYDGRLDSGKFGPGKKMNLTMDVHHLSSDGFETFNYQTRTAGALKFWYNFSDDTVLTGFSGVLQLNTNTPNFKGPLRSQVATLGYNYLLNNDSTSGSYYGYNFYSVPTDFEYVGFKTAMGHGWYVDTKPYTYSYYNHQNFANNQTGVIDTKCDTEVLTTTKGVKAPQFTCGTDKLNSYRKYGEISTISQVSKFGIFRTGLWYEWAYTNRFQTPQNPRNLADSALANFHEEFWTTSYQPFAEYEYHPTTKLTLTGGFKFAHFLQDLKQYADNGKTVGALGGAPFERNQGSYNSPLPSADANYRIRQNWSVYAQFATGSVIPPSSVFDVNNTVTTTPTPTLARTYQTGSVLKLKRVTLDGDVYYTHFQNTYTAIPDTVTNPVQTGTQYVANGDSVSKGFEGELNLALARGLGLYMNGTAGTGRYVSAMVPNSTGVPTVNPAYQHLLANTPSNTEAYGLTYQSHGLDLGIFNKRVGPFWNDSGSNTQVIPIDPFNITNLFFNYTLKRGSYLDGTKLRLTFNNLFDTRNIIGVTPATAATTFTPNAGDSLGLTPGRSITLTVTFGYTPKR
jgi:iron complex outermembrane receptor protein